MTEPSQEAVELVDWIAEHHNCGKCSGTCVEATEFVDSALRAVEQRTRLETLERAADYVLDQGDEVARGIGGREGARWREFFDALSAAIRALQPREIGCCDACWCQGRCIKPECECHPVEPREAPKAEEPEWVKPEEKCACDFHSSHVFCRSPMCTCAAPQPGHEEGR